ncbi:unnamed protein product [Rotaria magnacalcarata]|nr:unnamed protein product [Rotaria magnacalcarata]
MASPGDVSQLLRSGVQIAVKKNLSGEDSRAQGLGLSGVLFDVRHMENFFHSRHVIVHDTIYRKEFNKRTALTTVSNFFSNGNGINHIIYFSGHGEQPSGN